MKKHIIILIIIFTTQLYAEKQIELTPIVLPYDSLNIDEVYGYGATIIARSGNTIYHSTDDGASWEIALESETKLNQLYSKDPHTVFAIGDSGLVYRTMDYGTTWIDESVDTDLDLVTMAAKDAIDYLTLTNKELGFYREATDMDYEKISTLSEIEQSSIIFQDSVYIFGGGYSLTYDFYFRGTDYYEYYLPEFSFNGETVIKNKHYYIDASEDYIERNMAKYLKLFSSPIGAIRTGQNLSGINGLTFRESISHTLYTYTEGLYIDKSITHATVQDSTLFVFTKDGYLYCMNPDSISVIVSYRDIEPIDLKIGINNFTSDYKENVFYIASNNSTIYKVFNMEGYSKVGNKNVLLLNNKFSLIGNAKLLYITDYMGRRVGYKYKIGNTYYLTPGLHIVTYTIDGEVKSAKIMVDG